MCLLVFIAARLAFLPPRVASQKSQFKIRYAIVTVLIVFKAFLITTQQILLPSCERALRRLLLLRHSIIINALGSGLDVATL